MQYIVYSLRIRVYVLYERRSVQFDIDLSAQVEHLPNDKFHRAPVLALYV
jgi:hypothetical protein